MVTPSKERKWTWSTKNFVFLPKSPYISGTVLDMPLLQFMTNYRKSLVPDRTVSLSTNLNAFERQDRTGNLCIMLVPFDRPNSASNLRRRGSVSGVSHAPASVLPHYFWDSPFDVGEHWHAVVNVVVCVFTDAVGRVERRQLEDRRTAESPWFPFEADEVLWVYSYRDGTADTGVDCGSEYPQERWE